MTQVKQLDFTDTTIFCGVDVHKKNWRVNIQDSEFDISRFKRFDNLCSYVGLVPDTHDSGETKKSKGITNRSNQYLRMALVESSWSVVRKDPALLMKYKKYCRIMEKNKAVIRIAKHLLSRINYVLKKKRICVWCGSLRFFKG